MTRRLSGCRIESLDAAACAVWLDWVLGGAPTPPRSTSSAWLLAHCDDGVTWGRRQPTQNSWWLGSTIFPDLCPRIDAINLVELRLFGADEELLLWRDDSRIRGRWLIDTAPQHAAPDRPHEEDRVLVGTKLKDVRQDFSRVADGQGREQAVPIPCAHGDFDEKQPRWPLRLTVKHYFETDPGTGVVRVAASRLVNVKKGAQ